MTNEEEERDRKLKRATQLLFFRQHRRPGVRVQELKRRIGKDYEKVIEILNSELDKLDLEVKSIEDGGDKRFLIVSKSPLRGGSGWRVDDAAVLAVSLAYITSNHGKAPRKEIEMILKEKMPDWRVETAMDRFIKQGYLSEEEGMLCIDWRTMVEVDQKTLINLILEG